MRNVVRCIGLFAMILGANAGFIGMAGAADAPGPLVLERRIPLARVSGRIDHLAIDLGRQRLFVAELGNGTVSAIDLISGAVVHRFVGLREPQGIGYAPKADVIAVATAGDGAVQLFRGEDFAPVGRIDLKDDADNIRHDPATGYLVVGFGGGGLAVIDPVSRAVVTRMQLPAHPEGFQLDPPTRRAFVNLPDARGIAVVDLGSGTTLATWQLPGLRGNFPMAWEPESSMVATIFRHPARLVVLDARTGTVRQSADTCGDADDLFFDTRRKRIYVTCGEGEIAVYEQAGGSYRPLQSIATVSGARTSLFVPELDRLFVAERAGLLGSDAAIRVYRPTP